jgi:hypothetical protein
MVRTRRPPVLWLLVVAYGLLAASLLLLAAVVGSATITWDVKGQTMVGSQVQGSTAIIDGHRAGTRTRRAVAYNAGRSVRLEHAEHHARRTGVFHDVAEHESALVSRREMLRCVG